MPDSFDSIAPLPAAPATPSPLDVVAAPRTRPILPLLAADAQTVPLFEPGRHDRLVRWLVFAAIFTLYLMNAGSFGLWDPWETHYGEVARNMLETYDWVNPWWGYARKIGSEPIGGEWFYSKPIYIFWAELTFLKLIGLTDWAFRLPQALLGASMASMVYFTVERIGGRTYALMAAAVVALSPFVYMVSRQAQTDMPFVATMTIGLLFFALAFFSRRERFGARGFAWATVAFVAFMLLNLVPQLIIISTDLYDPNAGAGQTGLPALLDVIQQNGVYHLLVYAPVTLAILTSVLLPILRQRHTPEGWTPTFRDRWIRRFYMLAGYMMLAQATYAKGLLGFMLPGAILLFYLIATRTWGLLGRLELLRGVPLFFLTVSPWYVAMFCRHGMPYYQRFFIHDHFNRVGAGVHEIDTGTFEYFVKWLGFGMFPWAAFVPFALITAIGYLRGERPAARLDEEQKPLDSETFGAAILGQFKVMALLWFIVSFFVFTLSATRFHHYILPGVPALGMLVGFYLVDLRKDRSPQARLHIILALVIFVALAVNLASDYQNLRDMFTYKYDRPLAENLPTDWNAPVVWASDQNPIVTWAQSPFGKHVGPMVANILTISWFRFEVFIKIAAVLGALGVSFMLAARLRTIGLWIVGGTAALTAFWALDYYMPTLAPHWSQKYLFEAYYGDCHMHKNPPAITEAYTPLTQRVGLGFISEFLDARPKRVCEEDIVSWLITWRGETFYSSNEIRPLNKATQLEPYLREMNRGKTFYSLLERGRTSGFESKLKAESKKLRDEKLTGFERIKDWDCELVSNDSAYFVLARCTPTQDDGTAPVKRTPKVAKPPRGPNEAPDRGSSPNPSF